MNERNEDKSDVSDFVGAILDDVHRLNNSLATIGGFIEVLSENKELSGAVKEYISRIGKAHEEAVEISGSLFSLCLINQQNPPFNDDNT